MFHPRLVEEVRNGFYYLPSDATGYAGSSFTIPEGNKKSTFDQKQANAAKQPTQIFSNGNICLELVGAVDHPGSDIRTITSSDVVAGWTGNTYIGFWHRYPGVGVPSGLPSGSTVVFAHNNGTNNNKRIVINHSGTDETYSLIVSADGSATKTDKWDASVDYPDGATNNLWLWKEFLIVVGTGVSFFVDFVQRSQTVTAINVASLFNATASIALYSSAAAAGINQNEQQGGPLYYCNGIPPLKNRKRLANYMAPKSVKF